LENLKKVSPKGLQSLKKLHNAPAPLGIFAPTLFWEDQAKGGLSTSNKPEEEKERLAALLRSQKRSEQDRAPIQDNLSTRLYVGNLCPDAFESDLFDLFGKVAGVRNVEIARDRDGNPAGFGFVEMQTPEGAQAAIKQFHDSKFMGKRLIVNSAQPDEKLSGPCADSSASRHDANEEEVPPSKPPTPAGGLDYEKLRNDLRKEIKAEVLRELQIEPRTGSSENRSADKTPTRSGIAPTDVVVAPKNPDREFPPYRPRSVFRYSWLIFPVGLLIGWILLKLLPPTPYPQAGSAAATTPGTPKNQSVLVPETARMIPTPTPAPTSVVAPRPEETTPARPNLHVVSQGDTYWSLVRKYYPASTDFNYEIERLRKANPDLDERSLSIGTEVIIPPLEKSGERLAAESPEARGAEAAERLDQGETEEQEQDASNESNRRKSRLSKMMQMPAWSAPTANEQAYDDDKSF